MQKYDIHFCLISDQAAPTLLPILDNDFKPQEAVFFVSDKMKNNAESLSKIFQKKGVKVKMERIEDIYDFQKMETLFIDTVERYQDRNFALNVTGGTKLMAIVAQNVFAMNNSPIFYIDSDNNQILFISYEKTHLPNKKLNCAIDLKTYISAYGMVFKPTKNNTVNQERLKLVETFIKNYDKYQSYIGSLNYYSSKSEEYGFEIELSEDDRKREGLRDFFKELHDKNLLDFDGKTIDFRNRENKEFLNGIWLEEWAYSTISDIKTIQDKALSLEVGNTAYDEKKTQYAPQNQGNQNEFDIAFMAKNRLHIIECKTQVMNKEGSTKPEDILYKLEALKNYGGLMTKKCLVSYFEVPNAVKNRAKELHIEIIDGKENLQFQRLKNKIQDWIAKP